MQEQVADMALQGFGFQEWRIQERLDGDRVTALDRRFALVGAEAYAAAGGQTEADLFGELPDQLLDPEVLTDLWTARTRKAAAALEAEGLTVHVSHDGQVEPEGLEKLGFVYGNVLTAEQIAAYEHARTTAGERVHEVREADLSGEDGPERISAMLVARLAAEQAGQPGRAIRAVVLWPAGKLGVDIRFYGEPLPEPKDSCVDRASSTVGYAAAYRRVEAVEVPTIAVDTDGVGHALHEARTDMATRGLIRALADDPTAALVALIARLFSTLALDSARLPDAAAVSLVAIGYDRPKHDPVDVLDGEVRRRLAERRAAWKASGQRPIPWIAELPHGERMALLAELPHGERMALLAELVALSLDLREAKTSHVRQAARADAAEIAALTCADIAAYWTPDEAFLKVHRKKHLLAMLDSMGAPDDRARTLKHAELIPFVAERAAERGWAPAEVGWPAEAPDDGGEPSTESEAQSEAEPASPPDSDPSDAPGETFDVAA